MGSLDWPSEELPADAVELGRLGEAWGVKGWLRLHPYSADPEVLLSVSHWWLQPPLPPHDRGFDAFSGCVRVEVEAVKPHGNGLVARLVGVEDRTRAERLRGVRISVPRSAFPEQDDPDAFYWVDLMGLEVVNREGLHLGTVSHLLPTGPTSVLVLTAQVGEGAERKSVERLIPFVSAYVDEVDRQARVIRVDWQPDY